MPAQSIALLFVAAAIALLWLAVRYLLPWLLDRDTAVPEGAVHSVDILERVAAEGSLRTDSWQLEPSHRAPSDPYTPEQAHIAMQQHRDCGTDLCAAKHSAFWTLVDAGHAVPDARVER
ncbi:hypothetical protein [Nocardia sp. NBC_00403]|uniref:hypothetical protein n=1 Tax=Nocardia sp. NBC_00403 TaxID=2975990 RepID=UPI002E230159